jgi:hypothetical protein
MLDKLVVLPDGGTGLGSAKRCWIVVVQLAAKHL